MNRLQRLFGLGRAEDPSDPVDPVDPDTVVWVANIPLWQAPLIVTGLQEHDIIAKFAEVGSAKSTSRADVYVLERDRRAAEGIIAKLTAHKPRSRLSRYVDPD